VIFPEPGSRVLPLTTLSEDSALFSAGGGVWGTPPRAWKTVSSSGHRPCRAAGTSIPSL